MTATKLKNLNKLIFVMGKMKKQTNNKALWGIKKE